MLDDLFQQIDKAKVQAKSPQFAESEAVRKLNERIAIKAGNESSTKEHGPSRQPFISTVSRFGKEFSLPGFLT